VLLFFFLKFTSPRLRHDTQTVLGDALAAQDIKVSFGEPVHMGGYPTVKLDWFSTRRVNRWSGVVRQEKSAQHYQAVADGGGKTEVKGSEENSGVGEQAETENKKQRGSRHYEDKVVKSNTSFDSEAVANAIRQRRVDEGRKSPRPSREEIRRATNDKAAQAVQARINSDAQ
jgi:hypothetical protein